MEESLKIRPDYEKSVSQVYQDVVLQNISQLKDLDILRCCIMQDNPVAATATDIPSWVPDWAKPEESSSSFDHSHAAGESSAEARYIGNEVLEVTGVLMCIVEQVYTLDIDLKASDADAIALIWKLVSPNAKNIPYVGGGSLIEAYCRTFNGNNFSDRWLPELNNMLDFRSCLLSFTAFCSDEDSKDEGLKWSSLDLDATCGRYLDSFIQYSYGRAFFRTQEGYIGLAPRAIRAGDHVTVFLGCASPIILRPSENSETHRVVGESYIYGLADSVAFLGPMPANFAKVSKYDKASDNWWDAYLNRGAKEAQIEDPRLGELPVGWRVRKHKESSAWNWYVRDNGKEGVREEEGEDEEHDWRDNGDPRWTVEALRERGVPLKKFMLV